MHGKCKKRSKEYIIISIISKYRNMFSNKSNLENENLLFAVSVTLKKKKKKVEVLQNLFPFIIIIFYNFRKNICRNWLHYSLLNYVSYSLSEENMMIFIIYHNYSLISEFFHITVELKAIKSIPMFCLIPEFLYHFIHTITLVDLNFLSETVSIASCLTALTNCPLFWLYFCYIQLWKLKTQKWAKKISPGSLMYQ